MVVPAHDIPGRLRFSLPLLRADRRRAAVARTRVGAIPGVTSASANPLTGSLIVLYHPDAAKREAILAAVAEFRPAAASGETARERRARKLAEILANAIAERLVEHVIRAAVAVAM